MIPLENRNYLIKRLKEGWDLRNACADAKISRPVLYRYYKEEPAFKDKVQKTIDTYIRRQQKSAKIADRRKLMKVREISRK